MSQIPGRPLHRAAPAALALGWRAAPFDNGVAVVVTVLSGVLPAATAWTAKLLFDELARGRSASFARAAELVAVGAGLTCLSAVLALISGQLSLRISRALTLRVQDLLYTRVNGFAGLRYFEDPAFQDRLRLAEQGAQAAPGDVTGLLTDFARSCISVVSYGGVLLIVWPPMAVLLAASTLPAYLLQRRLAQRRAATVETMMHRHRRRSLYQQMLTSSATAKEVRLFGMGGLFHHRMMQMLRETTSADLAVERRGSLVQSVLTMVSAAVVAVGSIVVVRQVVAGTITLGDLTLFSAAVLGLQGCAATVLTQIGNAGKTMRLFGHYLDVLEMEPDVVSDGSPVPVLAGGIELHDVWFRYTDDGPWVLRGLTMTIPHGRAVGLVGLNGAGKSTLVKLLCRFYDPVRGRILWDGIDVRELSIDELRRRIGATFQDYSRYDFSARDNIAFGDLARWDDLDAIRRAAAIAGVDETLAALPEGYDTLLSRIFFTEHQNLGVSLSGGQWQRVALARSLLRVDADLLILDEPSAGLDAEAEHLVHEALRRHRHRRTSLLISHRLNTLRGADVIVVLAQGRVHEQGTHDELMSASGEYARLFRLQAVGYLGTPSELGAEPEPAR